MTNMLIFSESAIDIFWINSATICLFPFQHKNHVSGELIMATQICCRIMTIRL